MCIGRKTNEVYAIFLDEFMTKSILELIGMKDAKVFDDHFHLKLNMENYFYANRIFYTQQLNQCLEYHIMQFWKWCLRKQ